MSVEQFGNVNTLSTKLVQCQTRVTTFTSIKPLKIIGKRKKSQRIK